MQNYNLVNYKFGFHDSFEPSYKVSKGLSESILREVSNLKKEPKWMLKKRLSAFNIFLSQKLPNYQNDLKNLNLEDIYYYVKPIEKRTTNWDDVPFEIKNTFKKIGIPEAERKFLAGVGAQYDSEVIYQSISKNLFKKGVIFTDMDSALSKYPQIIKKYFGTVISANDNKFAALNTSFWSGGSFIYVPKNVKVDLPLQAYFRMNFKNIGQFERTLILAEEGSFVHYIEGCTAPIYSTDSLHAGVVEIIIKKGAHVRYTTVQNWSKNVYNLVTKRMYVEEEGFGEWVDCNLGSKLTMKYPSIYLKGKKSQGKIISLAVATEGQNQDSGGKIYHFGEETSSSIISKSINKNGGKSSFRGLLKIKKGAKNSNAKMSCFSLLLDDKSKTQSIPLTDVQESSSKVSHETVVSSIEENQLFYLRSRGIPKSKAESLIINGFVEPIVKELPLEYAIELNRLIQMET